MFISFHDRFLASGQGFGAVIEHSCSRQVRVFWQTILTDDYQVSSFFSYQRGSLAMIDAVKSENEISVMGLRLVSFSAGTEESPVHSWRVFDVHHYPRRLRGEFSLSAEGLSFDGFKGEIGNQGIDSSDASDKPFSVRNRR